MTQYQIDDFREVEATLKNKELRQALYDGDDYFLVDTLINMHGEAHQRKRKATLNLFTREFFREYENTTFPATLQEALEPVIEAGRGDMAQLGFHAVVNLISDATGLDRRRTPEETERILHIIHELEHVSTIGQIIIGSQEEARAKIRAALAQFDAEFYTPSANRRKEMAARGEELPRDIIATMIAEYPNDELPHSEMVNDAAFFLLAGTATVANALNACTKEILTWLQAHPEDRQRLVDDPITMQKFVWETLRLHPPQRVAARKAVSTVLLPTGHEAVQGDFIALNVTEANRSTEIFGEDATEFNPFREVNGRTQLTGVAFGIGLHSCAGRILAAGVQLTPENASSDENEYGLVHMIMREMIRLGMDFDPDRPAVIDESTIRKLYSSFPFVLRPELRSPV